MPIWKVIPEAFPEIQSKVADSNLDFEEFKKILIENKESGMKRKEE